MPDKHHHNHHDQDQHHHHQQHALPRDLSTADSQVSFKKGDFNPMMGLRVVQDFRCLNEATLWS